MQADDSRAQSLGQRQGTAPDFTLLEFLKRRCRSLGHRADLDTFASLAIRLAVLHRSVGQ